MSTSRVEGEAYCNLDKIYLNNQVGKIISAAHPRLFRLLRSYVFFNLIFLTIGAAEVALLAVFFALLAQSSILAFALGGVFLTFFSYFIIRIYFQSKLPDQLQIIQKRYANQVKELITYQETLPEHCVALSVACNRFSDSLQGKEYSLYTPPKWLEIILPCMERFSCWWHWHDLRAMREVLLHASIKETVKLVRCEPTSTEVHILLANSYVLLSRLYMDPRNAQEDLDDRWIPAEKYNEAANKMFRWAAKKAIEELKVVSEYAPEDPWIHSQLAYSYKELDMTEEEIREYEILLEYDPQDQEALFHLGKLYFQQGKNAHGLKVYEKLKDLHYKKAEALIDLYTS